MGGAIGGAVTAQRFQQMKDGEELYTRNGQSRAEAKQKVENVMAAAKMGGAVMAQRFQQMKDGEELYTRNGQSQAEVQQMMENMTATAKINGAVLALRLQQMKDGKDLHTCDGQSQAEAKQKVENFIQSNKAPGIKVASDKKWKKRFKELKEFKDDHDHFVVPSNKGEKLRKLSSWTRNQRLNRSTLSEDRKQMLDGIGFPWKVNKTWEEQYENLVEFKKKNHHFNIPVADSSLYPWVRRQRRRYRRSSITPKQRDMLNEIGFDWIRKERETKEESDYDSKSDDEALVESESDDESSEDDESDEEA
mmetsp:Transcript_15351/g.30991  ORF Transcript_15351/g.30991 Transcript_15351/m.30991 type:complete len:306 (+) Transcript_15351:1876-2793(+)